MDQLRKKLSRFFTGVRVFVPLLPAFLWTALCQVYSSTKEYWQTSQTIVDGITTEYMSNLPLEVTSDYDPGPYWICYAIASFLYLVGWIAMSWLTVEALRRLLTTIF